MDPNEFDWDGFEAEGRALQQRMREIADRNAREVAESRAARTRYEERRSSETVVRETPPARDPAIHDRLQRVDDRLGKVETRLDRVDDRLDRVEQTLVDIRGDLREIRERMATKVEVESLKDDIHLVADGFAQTQTGLARVADLLKRYLTSP